MGRSDIGHPEVIAVATSEITSVEVRTIDGEVWLNARHVTQRLRELAAENREAAAGYGDPIPNDNYPAVVGFYAAAQRFDETADRIDLAVIEHISESGHGQDLEA